VALIVGVQVMKALLLPIVFGFLYLCWPAGCCGPLGHALLVALVIAATAIFGVFSAISVLSS
jgi:hypothetical protein